jgi:hypothetical protein
MGYRQIAGGRRAGHGSCGLPCPSLPRKKGIAEGSMFRYCRVRAFIRPTRRPADQLIRQMVGSDVAPLKDDRTAIFGLERPVARTCSEILATLRCHSAFEGQAHHAGRNWQGQLLRPQGRRSLVQSGTVSRGPFPFHPHARGAASCVLARLSADSHRPRSFRL